MDLLSRAFDANRAPRLPLPWAPLARLALVAVAALALGEWIWLHDGGLQPFGRAAGTAAVHGSLVAAAATIASGGGLWRPAIRVAAAILVAAAATRVTPWGALAYLLPPVILIREGRRVPALRALGLIVPGLQSILVGLAAGVFLGIHLLVSGSLTFGYTVRPSSLGGYLSAVAYDVGASALSAECFFRGAVLTAWWGRAAFGWAAAGSTALALIRYLLDPAMPRTLEALAGAIFYLGLLGVSACALRAWSGSLLPGYLATLGFFSAYRLLGEW